MPQSNYDRVASVYDAGRAVSLAGLQGWHAILTHYVPSETGAPILDLGAGTGLFARAFVTWFNAHVVAVEPSENMRSEAIRQRSHPHISYLAGDAEHLPLDDSSMGTAWLSTVLHHIPDLSRCARELRRVLQPGAPVLIRGAFPERLDTITLFRYFPAARRVAESFPTIDATADAFATAGFHMESVESVPQETAGTLAEFYGRVRLRADTTLQGIDDDQFQRGLETLKDALQEESNNRPVIDELTLLILR